jgi:methionyl-tRNA formyltransferase
MRALIVGAVESTKVALRCLAASPGWEIAGVLTLPLDLRERHSDFVDLGPDAEHVGTPVYRFTNSNSDEAIATVAALAPDYIFVIGWSQLCGDAFLAAAPGKVIGYHPAPLPRLRGRAAIPWTIILAEPITAGTLFLIDGGTDSGPILAQHFFHVASDETAATLYDRHMLVLANMLPGLLEKLLAGTVVPEIQDERFATWATRRRPEDAEIDWHAPAAAIARLVRACGSPYPGARTTIGEEMIAIAAARPIEIERYCAAMPGQVIARDEQGFTVCCGDGRGLLITDWQRGTGAKPPPLHARLGQRARIAA